MAVGVGAAYNLNTNRQKITTGTAYVGGTTDYLHLASDVVFKWHSLALQGEVVLRDAAQDEIPSVGDDGVPIVALTQSGWGWVGQASYVFSPKHELVGRFSRIYALDGTDPSPVEEATASGNEVGAGVNAYFNGHKLKVQADWIALFGTSGFANAQHTVRTQVDVTF